MNVKWASDTWAIKLSALLSGKAMDVYTRMSTEDANDYSKLKKSLLTRYNYTDEGYRQRLRNAKPDEEETPRQFGVRLRDYMAKWIDLSGVDSSDVHAIEDLFQREQFVESCPRDLAVHLKRQNPKTLEEMADAAERYLDATGETMASQLAEQQRRSKKSRSDVPRPNVGKDVRDSRDHRNEGPTCYTCQGHGHLSRECPNQRKRPPLNRESGKKSLERDQDRSDRKSGKNVKNFAGMAKIGKQVTHVAEIAEGEGQNSTSQEETKETPRKRGTPGVKDKTGYAKGLYRQYIDVGEIEGQPVEMLRDTGCTGILVDASFVPEENILPKQTCSVHLVEGSIRRDVPLARVQLKSKFLKGIPRNHNVICVPDLMFPVVIGNVRAARSLQLVQDDEDVPGESSRDDKKSDPDRDSDPDCSMLFRERSSSNNGIDRKRVKQRGRKEAQQCNAVTTRAMARKGDKASQLKTTDVKTTLNVDPKSLAKLQKDDPTLARCWKKVDEDIVKDAYAAKFYVKRGLLYREHQETATGRVYRQVVVPKPLRQQVMTVNHDSNFSGHLAVKKTERRVQVNFYWPGMTQDIMRFCHSCDVCQRTTPKGKTTKVPLGKMPLVDVPFKRVAVDLVGPINPPSEAGHRFILTLVDYATRYPEAVPLKKTTTEAVAEALCDIYSRVGIPEEVLTDQGTQFMSDCMKEVSRLLSIRGLVSSPYHPQCNGLVERWNGTLKTMLKRLCAENPKQWHRLVNPVLFAYREVPQESTGFSPFELLYGRTVRGPGAILKQLWTKEVDQPEVKTSYQYVTDLRERLENTMKLAQEELSRSQRRYKKYYDRKAKKRSFNREDQVLVLLPTDNNKLLMQWKGPYTVIRSVGVNDYRIRIGNKEKTFHANMLKAYIRRQEDDTSSTSDGVARQDDSQDEVTAGVAGVLLPQDEPREGEIPDSGNYTAKECPSDVKIGDQLDQRKREQLQSLIQDYPEVFTDVPGKTDLIQHKIKLTSNTPVRCKPYPLPYAAREELKNEVESMLKMGVIRPSDSPYASPIVMVKKKDGSNRVCVDFRKLNQITIEDPEPMTTAEDLFRRLSGKKYLSKLDLTKGYWQIPVATEDIPKTAFVTPDGRYEFLRMPFGMVNSGATLVRGLRRLLGDMEGVGCYIDDIIVYSDSWGTHMRTIRDLLNRLSKAKITARPTKCLFGVSKMEFLGHEVDGDHITPSRENLEKIRNIERPTTKKQVRSFLGLTGYYRDLIPMFATIAAPLNDLLRKGQPEKIIWGEPQEKAFSTLKEYLLAEPVLKLPDLERPFVLRTDASGSGIGAVILQKFDGMLHPVGYASRKLSPAESRYATIERECLAIVWGVQRFRLYLAGRKFLLQTDHKPLVFMREAAYRNDRVFRWAMALQGYQFQLQEIPGKDNVGADFFSRIEEEV